MGLLSRAAYTCNSSHDDNLPDLTTQPLGSVNCAIILSFLRGFYG